MYVNVAKVLNNIRMESWIYFADAAYYYYY